MGSLLLIGIMEIEVYYDSNLTGCIFGLTLQTKHEDIYRAYLEATAFGTKMIMQQYQDWHMEVEKYLHVAVYLKRMLL